MTSGIKIDGKNKNEKRYNKKSYYNKCSKILSTMSIYTYVN